MNSWPDNLPPLQPWNEEKHAMMNKIKSLENQIKWLDDCIESHIRQNVGLRLLLEKRGVQFKSEELIAAINEANQLG
jgi:hypothetical protein